MVAVRACLLRQLKYRVTPTSQKASSMASLLLVLLDLLTSFAAAFAQSVPD